MIDQKWFSSKLRFAIFVDPTGADTLNDCLFLFKANDFKSAFARALSIGENEEKDYVNAQNKKVLWKFMEVLSLDVVGSDILDGAELYSEPVHLAENDRIPFAQFFLQRLRSQSRRCSEEVVDLDET